MDERLLSEAQQARDLVIRLDFEADRARLSYQHAIRGLHAAGGSLREIAEALGLSHQRVHQIVEGAEGKVALKDARADFACTFCGRSKQEARKVIAGPGIYICDACVNLATEVMHDGGARANDRVQLSAVANPKARCSFCGKRVQRAPRMAGTATAHICADCLGLCNDILVGSAR